MWLRERRVVPAHNLIYTTCANGPSIWNDNVLDAKTFSHGGTRYKARHAVLHSQVLCRIVRVSGDECVLCVYSVVR